jgi:thioredoxin 1
VAAGIDGGLLKEPMLFRALSFEEAADAARRAGRWLLVDATAEWCQPCKAMERTTWRDPTLCDWVKEHAIAIRLDIDANEEIARSLGIRSVPTVIAFKSGVEVDRVTGLRNAPALRDWLDGLERGETALDQLRRSIGDPSKNMNGRLDLARALASSKHLAEATDEYVWLWQHISRVQPSMSGVRVSFMASDIKDLVEQHEDARVRFCAIREATRATANAEVLPGRARFDWIVLNEILGEAETTVEWFDGVAADVVASRGFDPFAHRLIPLLLARGRWADAGRMCSDPKKQLLHDHRVKQLSAKAPKRADHHVREVLRTVAEGQFRQQVAILHASLLAAGRLTEARRIEAKALALDGSQEMREALDETAAVAQAGRPPKANA